MAQALETILSGWETSCSRAFREEQRCWRNDDLAWRAWKRELEDEKRVHRQLLREWRAYNVEQQVLNNCRALWNRYVDKNRRDVEEAAEMLKCLAQLGALTAGFAVSAFYDFQYTASSDNPVLPFFGVATALTVGFELNSCVLCTLLLSSVVKIGKSYITDEEETEYLWRLRDWAAARVGGGGGGSSAAPAPRRDFQRHWESRCEGLWRTALALFLSGIPTFFAVMGLAGYLKFATSPSTVIITAVLMAAGFLYTVVLSGDWAKSLLVGRSASSSPLDWQAGNWWQFTGSPAPATPHGPSPFGFHRAPDKDSLWPPAAAARRPYSRTLEELPYPTIVGLKPWPSGSAGECRAPGPEPGSVMAARPGGGTELHDGESGPPAGAGPVAASESAADGGPGPGPSGDPGVRLMRPGTRPDDPGSDPGAGTGPGTGASAGTGTSTVTGLAIERASGARVGRAGTATAQEMSSGRGVNGGNEVDDGVAGAARPRPE